jgi:hypothetical protein
MPRPKGSKNVARPPRPITAERRAFAAKLVDLGTVPKACEALGISLTCGYQWEKRKDVIKFMQEHERIVTEKLADDTVSIVKELSIGRKELLAKYWEFACIAPRLTNYNTSGQTKALDSIRDMLGMTGKEEPPKPADPGVDVFEAEWMKDDPTLQ